MEIKCALEELDAEVFNISNKSENVDNEEHCKIEHIDTTVVLAESKQNRRCSRHLKQKNYNESESEDEFFVNDKNKRRSSRDFKRKNYNESESEGDFFVTEDGDQNKENRTEKKDPEFQVGSWYLG